MKVGERGQVTIPKELRERFHIAPDTEVIFQVVNGDIVLRKAPRKPDIRKWKGRCKGSFADLGNPSVDLFLETIRGR